MTPAAAEPVSAPSLPRFEKQTLTERFVAEGCALSDFDRDGKPEVAVANKRGDFIFRQR